LYDNRGFFYSLLIIAAVILGGLAILGLIAAFWIGAIAIGLPIAAAVLVAIVCFFAMAWLPFAFVILVYGIFGYRRSIMTHRTRNTLMVTCIAIFIGDLFSVELTNSPLFQVINLPERVYAGYAAILVMLSSALYTRFVYLDGLATLAKAGSGEQGRRPILHLLSFPSFAIIAIAFDFVIPASFTAIVLDRHGCDGFELASSILITVNNDYELIDRWHQFMNLIEESTAWQQSIAWIASTARWALTEFPVLQDVYQYFDKINLSRPELRVCTTEV